MNFRVFQPTVAGASVIDRRHIEMTQTSTRTRLCATVEPTPAPVDFSASLGAPHFSSLEHPFAGPTLLKLDDVILATSNHLHVPGALPLAQHGVPAPG